MSEQNGESGSRDMSMLDSLLLHRIEEAGSRQEYAVQLGVGYTTIHGWIHGLRSPLHRLSSREKLVEDTGRDYEELKMLGGISVPEACDIVLDYLRETDPEQQALQKQLSEKRQQEQGLQDRFLAVIRGRGAEIEGSTYAAFMTGGIVERRKILRILEAGKTPPAMSSEAMRFFLASQPKPRS